jgi:RNA polymerase sigma-70 factor (ECF subfamily)
MPVMPDRESTRWTLIRHAAEGDEGARESFVRQYEPILRAYFGARWNGTPLRSDLDDTVQEVFIECFRQGGVLVRADPARRGGFRAFLHGVLRNVALKQERRAARLRARPKGDELDRLPADEERLSTIFDRAWAVGLLREASRRQAERADAEGPDAVRRVDLLRLRFEEGRPIREIARLWEEDPARLHREYARAREEFQASLFEVVAEHHEGTPGDVRRECERLLDLLA